MEIKNTQTNNIYGECVNESKINEIISSIISDEDINLFRTYLANATERERVFVLRHLFSSIWSAIHHRFPDIRETFLYSLHILHQLFAEYYPSNGLYQL